jgi:hypothetical protein
MTIKSYHLCGDWFVNFCYANSAFLWRLYYGRLKTSVQAEHLLLSSILRPVATSNIYSGFKSVKEENPYVLDLS